MYKAHGKQVVTPAGKHFADAVDEEAARAIVAAMNRPVAMREKLRPRFKGDGK